jgi:hypothetical protein
MVYSGVFNVLSVLWGWVLLGANNITKTLIKHIHAPTH